MIKDINAITPEYMKHRLEEETEQYKQEIERLNNDIKELLKENGNKEKVIKAQDNIIKEVREYIENHSITNMEWWITGEQKIECKFMKDANPQELLEILDKGSDKEWIRIKKV